MNNKKIFFQLLNNILNIRDSIAVYFGILCLLPKPGSQSDAVNKFCWWLPTRVKVLVILGEKEKIEQLDTPQFQQNYIDHHRIRYSTKNVWRVLAPTICTDFSKVMFSNNSRMYLSDPERNTFDCTSDWVELAKRYSPYQDHDIIETSKVNLYSLASKSKEKSLLLGNGPSIDSYKFTSDPCSSMVFGCNTLIWSESLKNIKFDIYSAMDRALFFSSSKFTQLFWDSLLKRQAKDDFYFLTTLDLAHLVLTKWPHLYPRLIALDMTDEKLKVPTMESLKVKYAASVLTSLMLPLAISFGRNIELLGVDGSVSTKNQRIWSHHLNALDELRDQTAQVHPTKHRIRDKESWYKHYESNFHQLVIIAKERGIEISSLTPSHYSFLT